MKGLSMTKKQIVALAAALVAAALPFFPPVREFLFNTVCK